MQKIKFILLITIILTAFSVVYAGNSPDEKNDWPMWRYDAGRTACAPNELSETLHLQWIHKFEQRERGWDDPLNHDLMPYDKVFEPVVMGELIYIGFNDSDKLLAININTGKEKWRYYCDGPVRLPPAALNGKVYFISDDGYLYCLDGISGNLIWKFQGFPGTRKVLGNKRLISAWPARGGIVIKDGILYFGASIWPFMGVSIYALDAETGKEIWVNDKESFRYRQQPHKKAMSFAGVAPQGALALNGDILLVPGGRSVPAAFNSKTGEFLYYKSGKYSKTGGSFIATYDKFFFSHYRSGITSMYEIKTGNLKLEQIGRFPVISENMIYFPGKSIIGYSLSEISNMKSQKKNTSLYQDKKKFEIKIDASGDLIRAGTRLYTGGKNKITALNIREPYNSPVILWSKQIEGKIERLLTAQGKLFAVTLDGKIIAFGNEKIDPNIFENKKIKSPISENIRNRAISILDETGIKEGYAVIFGIFNDNLIEAIIRNSSLHIIAIDPDPEKILVLRKKFDSMGLYGKRIAIHQGTPADFNIPQYIASLILINDLDLKKYPPNKKILAKMLYSLRPYGGTIWVKKNSLNVKFIEIAKSINMPGMEINQGKTGNILFRRKSALPGSASWTHNYGDIGQTSKSDDKLVKLPLGLLWFGGNSNTDVLPRHGHGPGEQVIGGRLFIEGMDSISARDVYTGRVLWKRELPGLKDDIFNVYFNSTYDEDYISTHYNQVHIIGANSRGANFVATENYVYIISKDILYKLDTATGEIKKKINAPSTSSGKDQEWGYIGIYKNKMIATSGFIFFENINNTKKMGGKTDANKSASKFMFVMDQENDKIVWQKQSKFGFLHNGIAAGNEIVFCLDTLPSYIKKSKQKFNFSSSGVYSLQAIDINTGNVIWTKKNDIFGTFLCYSKKYDILIQATRPSRDMLSGEKGTRINAFQGKTGKLIWDRTIKYNTFPIIHNQKIITENFSIDLMTGNDIELKHPISGEKMKFKWKRYYGCNYPIASENLLTFRSGAAGYFNIADESGTGNFGGFKSGCSANLIAADGVLNAPDYTRTCSCGYQNQTSLAMIHMEDIDMWTFNEIPNPEKSVKRIGINFGAPGDRKSTEGTLWLDYPKVGGKSPELPMRLYPKKNDTYLYNSSRFKEGNAYSWITASGMKNIESVYIITDGIGKFILKKAEKYINKGIDKLKNEDTPEYKGEEENYTVRLYFAEPDTAIGIGHRIFDIYIQDKIVIENMDIVKDAGQARKGIVKEFKNIIVPGMINVQFKQKSENNTPVLSGIELIAE